MYFNNCEIAIISRAAYENRVLSVKSRTASNSFRMVSNLKAARLVKPLRVVSNLKAARLIKPFRAVSYLKDAWVGVKMECGLHQLQFCWWTLYWIWTVCKRWVSLAHCVHVCVLYIFRLSLLSLQLLSSNSSFCCWPPTSSNTTTRVAKCKMPTFIEEMHFCIICLGVCVSEIGIERKQAVAVSKYLGSRGRGSKAHWSNPFPSIN